MVGAGFGGLDSRNSGNADEDGLGVKGLGLGVIRRQKAQHDFQIAINACSEVKAEVKGQTNIQVANPEANPQRHTQPGRWNSKPHDLRRKSQAK